MDFLLVVNQLDDEPNLYLSQGRSTPWSLGMGDLQPLIGNPSNGYINPYYWVDDHPLLYGNVMGV